ncbi:hypothetical protein BH11PLA2_BH11PLA2_50120 [soil metagenome]
MSRTLTLVPYALEAARNLISNEKFTAARKQIRLLLPIDPDNSTAYYLLGLAWENDPYGSDEQAHRFYRKALRLDSQNGLVLAALGRNAARLNKNAMAMKAMTKALRLAPSDVNVASIVVDTLILMGKLNTAWKVACAARFRMPESSVVKQMWDRVRFAKTAKRQMPRASTSFQQAKVLPLLRVVGGEDFSRRVRRDVVSFHTPHVG